MANGRQVRLAGAAAALVATVALPLTNAAPAAASEAVIVQAPSTAAAAAAVEAAGGHVDARLTIVDGVAAHVSSAGARALAARDGIAVTPDVTLHPTGATYGPGDTPVQVAALSPGTDDAPTAGDGIAVALVDTGVADTAALPAPRLVRGPDFSGEGDG